MVEGFFDEIPDSRQDWKVLHSIDEILTVVMCGVCAGENTIHGIYVFSEIKENWLREKVGLKLPNGNYGALQFPFVSLQPAIEKLSDDIGWLPRIAFKQRIESLCTELG